ncbi:MAG: hypothetical protein A2Y40_07465 [Candidatus Margulisbacteria bacterium GWF2_35_9]|nr:MAG: hypothetical protein A2Y40_07465 [Candidatus Margulisbacteria bacterium GWF2_35_9]
MEVKELLKKVRKIEIKSKKIVNTLFMGEYHSAFKGKGIEFSEVRNYQYGDDIRSIDWNVTSRMNSPFIKVNHEERELTLFLILDLSKSLNFGTRDQLKKHLIAELSAVFAYSASQNSDKVGLIIFADKVYTYIKPGKGRTQVLKIIRAILDFDPTDAHSTSIEDALVFFSHIQKKKAIAILCSDFYSNQYSDALRHVARKHQLIPVWIKDSFEEMIVSGVNSPMLRVRDSESGITKSILPNTQTWKMNGPIHMEKRNGLLENTFKQAKIKPMIVYTGKPYIPVMLKYFKHET